MSKQSFVIQGAVFCFKAKPKAGHQAGSLKKHKESFNDKLNTTQQNRQVADWGWKSRKKGEKQELKYPPKKWNCVGNTVRNTDKRLKQQTQMNWQLNEGKQENTLNTQEAN